jgi:adenylosuccinate lyase
LGRYGAATNTLKIDEAALHAAQARDGEVVGDLSRQLRVAVGSSAAGFVAHGATAQDLFDTALVMQIHTALTRLEQSPAGLIELLAGHARAHRDVPLTNGTHPPVTLGFLIAGWLAPLPRQRERLTGLKPRVPVIQLGGASGTLAALQGHGAQVQTALAEALGLDVPLSAWHEQRDGLAELAGWLLHEADTFEWRQFWPRIAVLHSAAAIALARTCELIVGLSLDPERLAVAFAESHGVSLAERYRHALTPKLGHVRAARVVDEACETALRERRHLADVLRAKFGAVLDWDALRDERDYLGDAGAVIDCVLACV